MSHDGESGLPGTAAGTAGGPGLQSAAIEVLRHRLASVAEGMGASLQRAAFSPNIKERQDHSCAVFDGRGRLLAQAAHIPVHLGALSASVAAAMDRIDCWQPGDLVLLNDPARGGSHLPDWTTVSPVFCRDADGPDFLLVSRAHHADVGGREPGSLALARDLHGEGLIIPPLRLMRRGRIDEDILALLRANSRTPEERSGDLEAQIAAHRHGEHRMREIAQRQAAWPSLCEALLDLSRRQAAAGLRDLPKGSFRAEEQMDGDGLNSRRYRLALRLDIEAERLVADFSGTDAAAPSGINAPLAVTRSALDYVLACLLTGVPINAGSQSVAELRVPPGSLLDPPPGSAVAAGNVETSQRVVDLLLRALAEAAPDRIPAASQGTMNNLTVGGRDPRGGEDGAGRVFSYYETLAGGAGGGPHRAGASAIQVHMTNTRNTPIEALETAFPMRVEAFGLRRGSGGAGRHPGGDGIIRRIRFLVPVRASLMTERRELAPYGLAGGQAGQVGRNRRIDREGRPTDLPAKGSFDLQAGEAIEIQTPGGGGWGSPESAGRGS